MSLSERLRRARGQAPQEGEAAEDEPERGADPERGAAERHAAAEARAAARRSSLASRQSLAAKAREGGAEESSTSAERELPEQERGLGSGARRLRSAGSGLAGALREGAGETRRRTGGAPARAGGAALSIVFVLFGAFFGLLGLALNLIIALAALLAGPGRRLLLRIGELIGSASRALTPPRALALVVAGAAVLLALSQFADYRSVSVGTAAYAELEGGDIAPAPEVDRAPTGSAHSYAMVPVAAVSLLLLAAAMSGRWRLCRLIALGGIAAVVVGLLVDRPEGLDLGRASLAYDGARANLLEGFYAQLFAGALLAAAALLLGRELQRAAAGFGAGGRRPAGGGLGRRLAGRFPRVGGAQA